LQILLAKAGHHHPNQSVQTPPDSLPQVASFHIPNPFFQTLQGEPGASLPPPSEHENSSRQNISKQDFSQRRDQLQTFTKYCNNYQRSTLFNGENFKNLSCHLREGPMLDLSITGKCCVDSFWLCVSEIPDLVQKMRVHDMPIVPTIKDAK
jgi:hypothetical protein